MNKGFLVTPGNDGFDPDWASKPDANVVADDAEHWRPVGHQRDRRGLSRGARRGPRPARALDRGAHRSALDPRQRLILRDQPIHRQHLRELPV